MSFAGAMIVALALDAIIGWPDALYRRIGHPVTWLGALIGWLDLRLNRKELPRATLIGAGGFAVCVVLLLAGTLTIAVQAMLPEGWIGTLILGVISWPLVAARSLDDHVARVAAPLAAGDLEGARAAVSMIVGRDPAWLDAAGVARAAIESLAENASDGVVAPLFWGAVAGLPGIAAYKAINTLDSMIGHRTPRHEAFGKLAARLDDVVNFLPARLTGLLMALASRRVRTSLRTMARDAGLHRSPNAGWPEAAMAGALGIRLSGPRVYDGEVTNDRWVNDGVPDPVATDLIRGLALFRRSMAPLVALLLAAALFGA